MLLETAVVRYDKLRRLGWCFGMGMGHQVGNADIFLVPDAGYHRDREFCHCPSDIVIVENQKIRLRSASPCDDNGILSQSRVVDSKKLV